MTIAHARKLALGLIVAASLTFSGCSTFSVTSETPSGPERVTTDGGPDSTTPTPEESPTQEESPAPEESPTPTAEPSTETTEPADDPSALDRYVELEASQIPALMDQFKDVFSEITIVGEQPDTIVFTYTYLTQVDKELALQGIESQLASVTSQVETTVFPAMERMGVTPTQKVRFVYLNADGSEVWSHEFTSS